jgi:hypothetical protein
MTMRLMLDNGPLGQLAKLARERWSWPGATLHVAMAIAREGATGQLTRAFLERRDDTGQPWVQQHDLDIDSDAHRMYHERLRPRSSHATKNIGEDASIALLAHELRDGVFVTMDGKAALSALVELGPGRVIAPFDCWRWLLEQGYIDTDACRDLDSLTSRHMGLIGPPPRLG